MKKLLERQVAQKEMQIQKLTDQQEKKRESMMNFYSQINEINQESDSHYNKCAEEAETFRAETNSKLGEVKIFFFYGTRHRYTDHTHTMIHLV